jgi:4-hydroxy-3-methylbut-2-en-1-yl diphosphate synthase IspG/GcpE
MRPVSVQSMTAGYTYDIDACVAEINKLAAAARTWSASPSRKRKTRPR